MNVPRGLVLYWGFKNFSGKFLGKLSQEAVRNAKNRPFSEELIDEFAGYFLVFIKGYKVVGIFIIQFEVVGCHHIKYVFL